MTIPKYIQNMLPCLKPVFHNQGQPGYTFKLYGKYRYGRNQTLPGDAHRLVEWARRNYADAKILELHQRDHYDRRRGVNIDYAIVEITDPVALAIEKH